MLFSRLSANNPEKLALEYKGQKLTYGELCQAVRLRSSAFKDIKKAYLLCAESELDNLLNFLAIIYVGSKAAFAGKNLNKELQNLYASRFGLEILDINPEENSSFADAYAPTQTDVFLGVLSSGSAGLPKLIWKDYQAWFSAFPAQSEIFGVCEQDRLLVVDALAYSANLNAVLHMLWQGGTVVLTCLEESRNWSNIIDIKEVSSVFLVPSHYRLLPETGKFPKVNSLVSAGEKLDLRLANKLFRLFPQAILTEYYGAAELGHISYIQNREIIERPSSVGRAFPGVKIELKEDKVWVESPYVSPEFRQKPTVSDLGIFEADGYLTLLGREGRMFNRRGLNIFAQEIENAALFHPFVVAAAAVQVEQKIHLILKPAQKLSPSELRTFLLKHIAKEKLPNRIIFVQDIPQNSSGKVDYKVLAKMPIEEDSY